MKSHDVNGGTATRLLARGKTLCAAAAILVSAATIPHPADALEDPAAVVQAYAEIGRATYEDALYSAKAHDAAI